MMMMMMMIKSCLFIFTSHSLASWQCRYWRGGGELVGGWVGEIAGQKLFNGKEDRPMALFVARLSTSKHPQKFLFLNI